VPLGLLKPDGTERLIGRPTGSELIGHDGLQVSAFNGTALVVMFAPTADVGDTMTSDGLGATFTLEVSDVARGVDGNTLAIRNNYPGGLPEGQGQLSVTDLQVGWMDAAKLPKPPSAVPARGAVAGGLTIGDITLAQSTRGGFTVGFGRGLELIGETALGMGPASPSVLLADDAAPQPADVKLNGTRWGPSGFKLAAEWPGLSLVRTLEVKDGTVRWKECWTNTGAEIRGVPFRHRLFLRDQDARFYVGGSRDVVALACSPCNPTLFLEAPAHAGQGAGVVAESDWLRLLAGWGGLAGVGEVYTQWLALAPNCSIDFDLTIAQVTDGGGYWSFINGVRRRWAVSDVTMQRPYFWGHVEDATIADPRERLAKALGNLGPIYTIVGPWLRGEPDDRVVRAGLYPKLPPEAPRAPGKCPDLDVDAFLSLAHREPYWEDGARQAALFREAAPNAMIVSRTHPSMECVYRPLIDRWPIAEDAIKTPTGEAFEDATYSRIWLGEMAARDWGVLYFCPRPGSAQLAAILESTTRAMDQYGFDGIYCDEFSFAVTQRGYSRYDYSRWDGYSADLDASGKPVRLKADNGYLSESCQLRLAGECIRRGKFFLGNGGNALRSLSGLPIQRFCEGGNGAGYWPQGHLSPVPLILGNMGDEKSTQGVFDSVRACLQLGSIYSPTAVNLLLDGPDNFVCKQYPISVEELGPGWVVGRERVITTVSRDFACPTGGGTVRLFSYDREGTRLPRQTWLFSRASCFRSWCPKAAWSSPRCPDSHR